MLARVFRLGLILLGAMALGAQLGCSGSGASSTTSTSTSGSSTGSTGTTTTSSSSSSSSGGTTGGLTLTVTSPTDGSQIALGTASDPLALTISYSVTGFTLATAGTCGVNLTTCGHVHIAVDGTACNAPGKPYNNSGANGNDNALFEFCLVNTGPHVIHLDLHDDQHALIPNSPTADVHVTTTAATSSPAVIISDPQSGSLVAIGADANGSVPVMASVSNFKLAAPGTCSGATGCGQVRFFVNGTTCNGANGYNAIDPTASGTADPALLPFAACVTADGGYITATGGYTITAALYDDSGNAVTGAMSGQVPVTGLAP